MHISTLECVVNSYTTISSSCIQTLAPSMVTMRGWRSQVSRRERSLHPGMAQLVPHVIGLLKRLKGGAATGAASCAASKTFSPLRRRYDHQIRSRHRVALLAAMLGRSSVPAPTGAQEEAAAASHDAHLAHRLAWQRAGDQTSARSGSSLTAPSHAAALWRPACPRMLNSAGGGLPG